MRCYRLNIKPLINQSAVDAIHQTAEQAIKQLHFGWSRPHQICCQERQATLSTRSLAKLDCNSWGKRACWWLCDTPEWFIISTLEIAMTFQQPVAHSDGKPNTLTTTVDIDWRIFHHVHISRSMIRKMRVFPLLFFFLHPVCLCESNHAAKHDGRTDFI